MSAVNNNAFTVGFPVTSAAAPEFGSVGNGNLLSRSGWRDSIGPVAQPVFSSPGDDGTEWSGGSSSASDAGLSGFNAIMNGFVRALQNMLASIGQQFGLTTASGRSGTPAQTYFTNATATSVGDPHETFDGTPGAGPSVDAKWNSMNSHADLLDSDSFAGGYRVSTTVTSPDPKGVTMNAQEQVALDGGATKISMNADGSYSVFEHGQAISLERGRAQALGNGESVTLDADSSLRVSAENDAGGSLVTTLTASGGGVDVKDTATNVDLGGYLVTHNDEPVASPGYVAVPKASPISYAYDAAPSSDVEDRGVFTV